MCDGLALSSHVGESWGCTHGAPAPSGMLQVTQPSSSNCISGRRSCLSTPGISASVPTPSYRQQYQQLVYHGRAIMPLPAPLVQAFLLKVGSGLFPQRLFVSNVFASCREVALVKTTACACVVFWLLLSICLWVSFLPRRKAKEALRAGYV